MRILGIDPGLATVGIGIVEAVSAHDIQVIDWYTITTAANTPLPDRLQELSCDLTEILDNIKPDIVVVEQIFFSVNKKTASGVAQARGVLISCIAGRGIPILEPSPTKLKMCIPGDGSADKKQMQNMVVRTLKLKEAPKPDDAADALALAIFGAVNQKRVQEIR